MTVFTEEELFALISTLVDAVRPYELAHMVTEIDSEGKYRNNPELDPVFQLSERFDNLETPNIRRIKPEYQEAFTQAVKNRMEAKKQKEALLRKAIKNAVYGHGPDLQGLYLALQVNKVPKGFIPDFIKEMFTILDGQGDGGHYKVKPQFAEIILSVVEKLYEEKLANKV